jgi:hypothetical protein
MKNWKMCSFQGLIEASNALAPLISQEAAIKSNLALGKARQSKWQREVLKNCRLETVPKYIKTMRIWCVCMNTNLPIQLQNKQR